MKSHDQRSGQVISQLPKVSKRGMNFVGGDSPVPNQVLSFSFSFTSSSVIQLAICLF